MLLTRVTVDCDLSETSLEDALSRLYGKEKRTLVVGVDNIKVGQELSSPTKSGLRLMVETNLPANAWYVHNEWSGVFSPGC
jgi:hypothetical protein